MSYAPFMLQSKRPRIPKRVMIDNFGLEAPENVLTFLVVPQKIYRDFETADDDKASLVKVGKNKFQVNLNVRRFTEQDILVKAADRHLVIEVKHEEQEEDNGFVSRSFTRRYSLPDTILEDAITSKLSDGVLTVTATLKPAKKQGDGRKKWRSYFLSKFRYLCECLRD